MRTLVRIQAINIDHPREDSDPWVFIRVQEVDKDDEGNVLSLRDRTDSVYRKGTDPIMTSMVTFIDPVTGHECTISKLGVYTALSVALYEFVAEDLPVYVGEDGQLYKVEG